MYTISANEIDRAAQEKSVVMPWGYEEYIKVDGEWVKDHLLVVDAERRITHKIYLDNRESEIIHWAS